jgi:hypothetical protein
MKIVNIILLIIQVRPGHSLKIKNVSDCLPKFTIERAVKGMLSETEKKD